MLLLLRSPGLEPLAHGGGGLVAALPRLELLPAAAAPPQQPRHPCSVQPGHVPAPHPSPLTCPGHRVHALLEVIVCTVVATTSLQMVNFSFNKDCKESLLTKILK